MVDFRHGIFWSIRLNRTVVIPVFFEHFTINPEQYILPEHRVDWSLLSELVSMVSAANYGNICKGKLSSVKLELHEIANKEVKKTKLKKYEKIKGKY